MSESIGAVGRDEASPVRNLSLGGVFVETCKSNSVGSTATLDFRVREGQIRADAVVRRVEPSRGLGLKFTAVSKEDRPRLAELRACYSFAGIHPSRP